MTGTEPHAPRCTAGRGLNWDRRPRAGHAGGSELHGAVRKGTAGCGPNRDHGQCTSRGSYASTHAHLSTACVWEPLAASGPGELRDSERSHGCRRDTVTVCSQYPVPQVTVSDDSTCYSELAQLHFELGFAVRILPLSCGQSIKADGVETRQSSYNTNRV
jgi:hypothetical protein